MTAGDGEDTRRATALGRRAYGSDDADGPVVHGVCARTAARRRGFDAHWGSGARRGVHDLGRCTPRAVHASGGARPQEARVRTPGPAARGARRRGVQRSALNCFTGALFEMILLQIFL
jgi:hypothetical protein